MSTTIMELEKFVDFVRRTAQHQDDEPSLEECLRLWREEQELAETVADIQTGIEDIKAGRYTSVEEADRLIRASLGWPPPRK